MIGLSGRKLMLLSSFDLFDYNVREETEVISNLTFYHIVRGCTVVLFNFMFDYIVRGEVAVKMVKSRYALWNSNAIGKKN